MLISIGRKPDLNCLGILKNRIQQERGFVAADEYMRTNIPNICGRRYYRKEHAGP
ncbi:MAG: hypothetical protein ACLSFZ_05845 [Frisingicoccus sp.]